MLLNHFIFTHIMKTGGTTFNRIIRGLYEDQGLVFLDKTFRKYRRDEIVLLNDLSEKSIPYQFNPDKHQYILGHFTADKYNHLNWPRITFLRDPVKRVCSYYSVWYHSKLGPAPKWSVEKFAKKTANYMHFMTRGDLDRFVFVGICERYEESLNVFEKIFNIKVPDKKVWYNQTPARKKYEFTKKQKQFIEKVNKKDRKLYNEALVLFDKQVKKYL